MESETRKESLSAMKVCRFCLTHQEPLSSLYEKSKAPKHYVTLPMKIMASVGIEVFPSDRMPQYICNRCKLFMEMSYGFKQVCRQADQSVLHFVQDGTLIEPITWPTLLNKVFRAHTKAEFGSVKTVTQDGATVKVTAEEISDIEEGDDDNVYNVKIGDGSEAGKSIKVITSVDNQTNIKDNRKDFSNMSKLGKHLRTHAGARSYPCKHCDKSFLKSHHYTRHLRVKHSDMIRTPSGSYNEADAWRCEECEDSFGTQDDLLYHSALHATASLTCPLCQEKFGDVETVTAHIRSHGNGAEFMCDYCELIFTTQQKLDTHIANIHDGEFMDKDTENDEGEDSMDYEEGDDSINVKEVDGHMVVEIKKAGDYMLPDTAQMEEEEDRNETLSEDSAEMDMAYTDGIEPPAAPPAAPKPVVPVKKDVAVLKNETGVAVSRLDSSKNAAVVRYPAKPAENIKTEAPSILKKAEEVKRKVVHQSVSNKAKEKPTVKVESSTAAGGNDLSLRLLEKELQDLQRTSRNDVQKIKRHLQTSTPKPKERLADKKETTTPKSVPEKTVQEKRSQGRPPKESRESRNASIKEEKDGKEKTNVSVKEEKETKDAKEKDTPKVVKNGASEKTVSDEPVRRSNRASKIKDYAKMISDSGPESEEEYSEEEPAEETAKEKEKEEDKSMETPRRGRKPLPKATPQKPQPAVTTMAASAAKKRGRPRKEAAATPSKVSKKDASGDEDAADDEADENKSNSEERAKPADGKATEPKQVTDPASNVMMSPSGQTLKQVPIKALPPGIKPLPLPRKITSGEVCEMQIGKKVVKVQKIVMTKAEADAMIKKGLVEMKDGTIVLKQGIKLPGSGSLKSQLMAEAESKKESPKNVKNVASLPTRCDFTE